WYTRAAPGVARSRRHAWAQWRGTPRAPHPLFRSLPMRRSTRRRMSHSRWRQSSMYNTLGARPRRAVLLCSGPRCSRQAAIPRAPRGPLLPATTEDRRNTGPRPGRRRRALSPRRAQRRLQIAPSHRVSFPHSCLDTCRGEPRRPLVCIPLPRPLGTRMEGSGARGTCDWNRFDTQATNTPKVSRSAVRGVRAGGGPAVSGHSQRAEETSEPPQAVAGDNTRPFFGAATGSVNISIM
ncbi:hypothetical protein C8R46DRAFT_1278656, partial [Mycena filopes]